MARGLPSLEQREEDEMLRELEAGLEEGMLDGGLEEGEEEEAEETWRGNI